MKTPSAIWDKTTVEGMEDGPEDTPKQRWLHALRKVMKVDGVYLDQSSDHERRRRTKKAPSPAETEEEDDDDEVVVEDEEEGEVG